MSLNLADVKRIAHLARIAVEEDEMPGYLQQLSNILGLVEEMQAIDTTGIEPMAHAAPRVNVMRDDTPGVSLPRDLVLANAPTVADEAYIQVPVVIEEDY